MGPSRAVEAFDRVDSTSQATLGPKASRARVWHAAEQIVSAGRRPTVAGIREILGGGSPNSVTAYLNDWYRELGSRLNPGGTAIPGTPPEAGALLAELWRLALQRVTEDDQSREPLRRVELEALEADRQSLKILNDELRRRLEVAGKALADTRALLARREAACEEERSRALAGEQLLANTQLKLAVALERLDLRRNSVSARFTRRTATRRPLRARKRANAQSHTGPTRRAKSAHRDAKKKGPRPRPSGRKRRPH